MPKQVDYPRASLRNCLELAGAVSDLGGSCSTDLAADKLGKKVSGAFNALVASGVKYALINKKSSELSISEGYREYKLAYNPQEERAALVSFALSPPLFRDIYTRFCGHQLPVDHLARMLVREHEVPDDLGSRVSGYLLDAFKVAQLLSEEMKVLDHSCDAESDNQEDSVEEEELKNNGLDDEFVANKEILEDTVSYSIRIKGPGVDSLLTLKDESDLIILDAYISKIKRYIE